MINELLWTEKYRPQKIDDCIVPQSIKDTLKSFVASGDFPSILLYGSQGVGKTTVAKALCNELDVDWILINSSNERGIDVLRDTIDQFASSVSLGDKPFKCVILDEFDHASNLLQAAMRGAIERFSKTCRFIFTCNYPNKIIDPIHSRCTVINLGLKSSSQDEVLRLKTEMASQFLKRVEFILKNENVKYERKALVKLIGSFFPDYRRIINELQRLSNESGTITENQTLGIIDNLDIGNLLKHLKAKDFTKMRTWVAVNRGNDVNLIFRKLYDSLVDVLDKDCIPEAIIKLAEYQFRSVTCPDQEINLAACCVELMTLEYV